ncbi:endonuclease domain-containing 1 protein-like [Xyrauchen texanus]|uniref:endonuclease domain-containing 1 protein-like n=1 Tax=Xyrauchen texanus TaxID=154827 RepID=UPI00224256BB|nr:endonuclease domain-containing 1 protein-like [Xyrauchen texanus]
MQLFISVLLVLGFQISLSEVVNFSECSEFFHKGKPPVITGILENSRSKDSYKTICQKYNNKYRFATLYETTNRSPVFSAYKYTKREEFTRPANEWMVEPQLEPSDGEMSLPYVNQATTEDYWGDNYKLNHGHLFPCCHAMDEDTAKSTFTLTNIVPQSVSFNKGSWNHMERKTRDDMDKYCRDRKDSNRVLAHVLTGAVPGNNKLNKRVNVPSHMWMAFCCYNSSKTSLVSQAYWAQNKEENFDGKTIDEKSLQELQEFLRTQWKKNVLLFDNNCSV